MKMVSKGAFRVQLVNILSNLTAKSHCSGIEGIEVTFRKKSDEEYVRIYIYIFFSAR